MHSCCVEHVKMCKAFKVLVQFNPPEVSFVITVEVTETQKSVFLSVTHLVNARQNWMSGLLISYPVFFPNTIWCFLVWAWVPSFDLKFLLLKASNFRRLYIRPKELSLFHGRAIVTQMLCFLSEGWLVFSPFDRVFGISSFCRYHNFRSKAFLC